MFVEAMDDDIIVDDKYDGVTVAVCVVIVDDITVIVVDAIVSVPGTASEVSIARKELQMEFLVSPSTLVTLLISGITV